MRMTILLLLILGILIVVFTPAHAPAFRFCGEGCTQVAAVKQKQVHRYYKPRRHSHRPMTKPKVVDPVPPPKEIVAVESEPTVNHNMAMRWPSDAPAVLIVPDPRPAPVIGDVRELAHTPWPIKVITPEPVRKTIPLVGVLFVAGMGTMTIYGLLSLLFVTKLMPPFQRYRAFPRWMIIKSWGRLLRNAAIRILNPTQGVDQWQRRAFPRELPENQPHPSSMTIFVSRKVIPILQDSRSSVISIRDRALTLLTRIRTTPAAIS